MEKLIPLFSEDHQDYIPPSGKEESYLPRISEPEYTQNCIKVSYNFPGFNVSKAVSQNNGNEKIFRKISITGAGYMAEEYKPMLPSLGRYVQIPFFCSYRVLGKGDQEQKRTYLLDPGVNFDNKDHFHPFPYISPWTEHDSREKWVEIEYSFKDTDLAYPEKLVQVTGPYIIDGFNSLLIHVRPLQYDPHNQYLAGYGNIDVKIELSPLKDPVNDGVSDVDDWKWSGEGYRIADPELQKGAFDNLFINPVTDIDDRVMLQNPIEIQIPVRPPGIQGRPEFLIFHERALGDAARQLAYWKNRRGLATETIPITNYGDLRTINIIKHIIRTERKSTYSKLDYVLLMGDINAIPTEVVPDLSERTQCVTDYYYSTAEDWRHDWGDVPLPWVALGRIPVRHPEIALKIVKKIIGYEESPAVNGDYYSTALTASFEDIPRGSIDHIDNYRFLETLEEKIKYHLETKVNVPVDTIYTSNPETYLDNAGNVVGPEHEPKYYKSDVFNQPPQPGPQIDPAVVNQLENHSTTTSQIESALKSGRFLMAARCHGSNQGWTRPEFNNNNLATLSCNNSSIIYSVSCETGDFGGGVVVSSATDSFAEKLLRMTKGGAASLIAPTSNTHADIDDEFIKALFDASWPGLLNLLRIVSDKRLLSNLKYNRIGDILKYAKIYLLLYMSANVAPAEYIKDHVHKYHVLGDPTLEVWKKNPHRLRFKILSQGRDLCVRLISAESWPSDSIITVREGDMIRFSKRLSKDDMKQREYVIPWLGGRKIQVQCWAPGYHFELLEEKY